MPPISEPATRRRHTLFSPPTDATAATGNSFSWKWRITPTHLRPNVSAADTIAPDWWRAFGDPYLDQLVDRAIAGNFDVKILAARIQVAKAQIDEARAGALPTLDIGAGASFEKTTGEKFSKTFNLGTQVNWELDVWGKVEKGVQAPSVRDDPADPWQAHEPRPRACR